MHSFEDHKGQKVYLDKIKTLVDRQQHTLPVDFNHLVQYSADADKIAELANFIQQVNVSFDYIGVDHHFCRIFYAWNLN